MGKSRLNEVRACPIFFADTKEAISNFILRQPHPLSCLIGYMIEIGDFSDNIKQEANTSFLI